MGSCTWVLDWKGTKCGSTEGLLCGKHRYGEGKPLAPINNSWDQHNVLKAVQDLLSDANFAWRRSPDEDLSNKAIHVVQREHTCTEYRDGCVFCDVIRLIQKYGLLAGGYGRAG